MDANLHAKFGPPPPFHSAALPATLPATLPPERVLAAQFAACVLVLVVVRPPFVMEFSGARPRLSVLRVGMASALAVGVTVCASGRTFKEMGPLFQARR